MGFLYKKVPAEKNPDGCRYYALFSFLPNVTFLSKI